MWLAKALFYLMISSQLMVANAASGEANEGLSNIIKKNTTPALRSMYLSKNLDEKALIQSDNNTRKLAVSLLLQNQNIEPILRIKNININSLAIIDSCELRIGLQTKEMYDLFCTTAYTPARALIELSLTPLQATCLTGDLAAMKMLIKAGANIDGKPKEMSPVASCLATKKLEQVDFLIDQGADVRVKYSPFSLLTLISKVVIDVADQVEAERLAEKIIAKGADPHYFYPPKNGGFSEIDLATMAGNLAMVKVLVKHGVDFNKKSSEGLTPLAFSKNNNHVAIAEFLESRGAKR
jgi:ankyrin repeat protein